MYREISAENDMTENIERQQAIIDKAEKKKNKLLDYNIEGHISDADYLERAKQCENEIKAAREIIKELESQMSSEDELASHIAEIRTAIREAYADSKGGIITNNICPVRQQKFTRIYRWLDGHKKEFTYSYFLNF